jgi:hypothetical protein
MFNQLSEIVFEWPTEILAHRTFASCIIENNIEYPQPFYWS